jgi:glycosyltransferase involved in cell wall biosynthesis
MKVAIVHYWLVNMRGGEKVLEALLELFPGADIYTHVYVPGAVSPLINSHSVYTSYINKLPFAGRLYQKYMPLMIRALNDFDLQKYDLVISSESGPAKGVVPNPEAYHLCYCHSPMRYLWDMYHEYFRESGFFVRFFMKKIIPALKTWDVVSANMVDRFVTNSNYVRKRISRAYRREADVVFPPVAIERFLEAERRPEGFYLFFGQLTGYKRADLAIRACISSKRRLIVAGAGGKKRDIRKYEKSGYVSFTGRVSDGDLVSLLSRARALIFPGIEDFGIVPVEANAAGCPVIAFREGGARDTIRENVTGIFFDEQTPDSLIKALDRFELVESAFLERGPFRSHVRQFSREKFKERILKIIEERKRI